MRRIKTSDDILRFYVDMGANATREGIIMRVEQLPSNQVQCQEVCDVRRKADWQRHLDPYMQSCFERRICKGEGERMYRKLIRVLNSYCWCKGNLHSLS